VDATAHLQQSMALMGLIPAVIRLAGHATALPIRCEAAQFMHQFCHFRLILTRSLMSLSSFALL
jgi:hypothetical protein